MYEIRTVLDDVRSNSIGGLSVGIDLWESAVLPMLLFNAETWFSIPQRTMDELENLQKQFFRCILAVGSGCPIPSLYWETGGMLIKNRILLKKLLFLHHISTLPDSCLAKEVYILQKELHLPGILSECKSFLNENGLCKIEQFTKLQWKKKVKELIMKLNKDDLVEMSKKYKKINFEYSADSSTRHLYLSTFRVHDARLLFKIRSRMVPTVKMNFLRDKDFASSSWVCSGCNIHLDSQAHVMSCESYSHLREGLDLKEDRDLVRFFRDLLDLRNKLV